MDNQEQKKKKLPLILRILKWTGIGLLALLIIVGLILQAPWKITAILIIFLLACTILPKRAGKWFWLTTAIIVIALVIWVFLPDDDKDWQPCHYDYEKELKAIENKIDVPDSENVATIYNILLEDYNDIPLTDIFSWEVFDKVCSNPWVDKDYPKVAEWLGEHEGKISVLLEASKIKTCKFPVDDPYIAWKGERVSALREWAYLLIISANNDLGQSNCDNALKKYLVILTMANHSYQQPTTLDLLVGMVVEGLVIGNLNKFIMLTNLKETDLTSISETIAENRHEWGYHLNKILGYEKLCKKNGIAGFYEVGPKGKIRLSRDPWRQMRALYRENLKSGEIKEELFKKVFESIAYPGYWQKKRLKALTIYNWFILPSKPEKAAEIIDKIYEKYYPMAEPNFKWSKKPQEYQIDSPVEQVKSLFKLRFNYICMIERLAQIQAKSYYQIHNLYLRLEADRRGTQLLVALRRYKNNSNKWPAKLDDIKSLTPSETFIDPLNNDTFIYKLADDSFKLYGKGMNGIDENGRERSCDPNEKDNPDDMLIWPTENDQNIKKQIETEE